MTRSRFYVTDYRRDTGELVAFYRDDINVIVEIDDEFVASHNLSALWYGRMLSKREKAEIFARNWQEHDRAYARDLEQTQ